VPRSDYKLKHLKQRWAEAAQGARSLMCVRARKRTRKFVPRLPALLQPLPALLQPLPAPDLSLPASR